MTLIRNARDVPALKVHDLNEIMVLVDRSETDFTEVGLNTWPAGINGPPHAHPGKEQIFLVLSGEGSVIAGGNVFHAEPGVIIYVPPGVEHQTIAGPNEPLTYFLFNAFLNVTKEGHRTFAEHIEKVRDTRKAQAEGHASSGATPSTGKFPTTGNLEKGEELTLGAACEKLVLSRSLTVRSEVVAVMCPPQYESAMTADQNREQVLYFLDGQGVLTIAGEAGTKPITSGDAVYIPAKKAFNVNSGEHKLHYIKFYTDFASDLSGKQMV